MAIEYTGEQHYRFIEYFRNTIDKFMKNKREYLSERKTFKEHHVYLLEMPYTVPIKKMGDFIIKACERHEIPTRYKKKIRDE